MPEGDTIHHAANRIRPVLAGRVPDEIETPHPRFGKDRWPARLAGRRVDAVDAHGKHLFIRFEGDLVIHSHLRMTGWWGVFGTGERWRRSPKRAWLVLRTEGREVVQFDGPVLDLMTASRTRFDQQLAALGPDVLAPEFDRERFLRRLREDDPTRPIGDALLDQRTVAGLGTIWRTEGCFAAALDPWRPTGRVGDAEVAGRHRRGPAADGAQRGGRIRPRRHRDLRQAGAAVPPLRPPRAVEWAGREQPSDILVPGMPDMTPPARTLKRIGHKGADLIAPGNTIESFDAALAAGVDMVEFDVLPENRDGSGRLVLAHDYEVVDRGDALTLEEGLAHFSQDAWAGVELNVDMKRAGYERRVVDALREHGLADRALISTMEEDSLAVVRLAGPEIRLGWSVPKIRRNPLDRRLTRVPALILARYAQRILPGRAATAIRDARIDALMCHWALVTRRLVTAIEDAGGELYVWTVDDADRIAKLERLGVTGIITNDPRLFGPLAA